MDLDELCQLGADVKALAECSRERAFALVGSVTLLPGCAAFTSSAL